MHHLGCDLQRCPGCGGQLITCDCGWDEFGGAEDGARWDDDHDGVGDGAEVLAFVSPSRAPDPVLPVRCVVFGAAVAPLRARHLAELRGVATWALQHGRPCDLDAAALCCEVVERFETPAGFQLDRRTVTTMLHSDVRNWASCAGTDLPDDVVVHLWSVLVWLHAEGRLTPDSDPLAVLLEPLGCYGRLGPDGYPLPAGAAIDFPCQCFLPHDPTCPSGYAQRIVGRDPVSGREFIVRARLRRPSEPPEPTNFDALKSLARRSAPHSSGRKIQVEDFDHIGCIDASGAVPPLWLYFHHRGGDAGRRDLVVDAAGQTWWPKADRRRKAGFRWEPIGDLHALLLAGVESPKRGVSWAPPRSVTP